MIQRAGATPFTTPVCLVGKGARTLCVDVDIVSIGFVFPTPPPTRGPTAPAHISDAAPGGAIFDPHSTPYGAQSAGAAFQRLPAKKILTNPSALVGTVARHGGLEADI